MADQIGTLQKIKLASTEALSPNAALSDDAKALIATPLPIAKFLGLLLDAALLDDAVKLFAHALPKREAVWWACLAARSLPETTATPELEAAIDAAEAWVYKPSEENRRAALDKATASGLKQPASWAAMAAAWSGGSLAPPNAPVVPPAEHLTGLAVVGVVLLAAVANEPAKRPEKLKAFLAQAIDIGNGGNGRNKAA